MMCRSVSGENEFDGRAASSKVVFDGVLRYKR
jgi:hypothetical protein